MHIENFMIDASSTFFSTPDFNDENELSENLICNQLINPLHTSEYELFTLNTKEIELLYSGY